jgi:predicted ATPase/class 3 adenylate cyclase
MKTANDTAHSGPESPLPAGTVTLMFTDVQGSTAGWEAHGSIFGEALRIHDELVRRAITEHGGHVVKSAGDGFMAAFTSAAEAIEACVGIQTNLAAVEVTGPWASVGGIRVRIGLHTGEPALRDNDYFGPPVNRAARIADAAHGGMVLISGDTLSEARAILSPSVQIKDHQSHRLKDLGQPVRLYEVRSTSFQSLWCDRPLRTLESLQHNFPQQMTSLVGRQRERDALNAMLSRQANRLISLTGPGGSGKTRLALQVAADRLQDYRDGVWLVDLAPVRDPGAVAATIAHALRVDIPASTDARSAIIAHLRTKQVLLVLDNFEQVADAAPLVTDLLRESAGLTCLITSREYLHLSGEKDFPVEPLAAPAASASHDSHADWASYESVQLFLERCQSIRGDFELTDTTGPIVGEICRRLDGIPLAVELAAARMRVISPAQILQKLTQRFDILSTRLRDGPARQQTLRSTLDWSYDLLTEDERALFCEMAVFQSGFFLEAAEAVSNLPDAMELVFSLRDKSLLKTGEALGDTRYYMLETIREYAQQKLIALGSLDGLRDRHAAHYLDRASAWSERLASAGGEAEQAEQVFRSDLENIRAGMDWASTRNDPRMTMAFGKALFPYLRRHGLYDEGDTRLAIAEDAARDVGDQTMLARLLNQRGLLAMERGQLDSAAALLDESHSISAALGDSSRALVACANLGNVYWLRSEFALAREKWEAALALAGPASSPHHRAFIRENIGILACQEGRLDEAEVHYAAALDLHRANGNREGIASTLYNSSEVWRKRREFERAASILEESHNLYASLGHQRGIALASVRMGLVLIDQGQPSAARERTLAGLEIARSTDNRHAEMYALTSLGRAAMADGDMGAASSHLRRALEMAVALSDRRHKADTIRRIAEMLYRQSRGPAALRLLLWVEREYGVMGVDDAVETARDRLVMSRRLEEAGIDVPASLPESYSPEQDLSISP